MPIDIIEHIDDPNFEKVLAACKKLRVRVNVTVRNGVSVSCRAEVSGNTRSIDFDLIGLNSNLSGDAQRRYRSKHDTYLKQHLKQMRPKRPGIDGHFGGASIRFQVLEQHASEWFDDVYAALQDTANFTPIPAPFEMFRKKKLTTQPEPTEKPSAPKQPPAESPEITALRTELKALQRPTRPKTPDALKEIQRVLKTFERPSSITKYVKQTRGSTCQLCGFKGFKKRNGKLYCEVHHLFHLSKKPPADCLGPEYLVVLCATCHRRMHYAEVGEPMRDGKGWWVSIDGEEKLFEV